MNDGRRSISQAPLGKKGKDKRSKRRLGLGEVVKSKPHNWTVVDLLGCGGFGDVYKVRSDDPKDSNEFYAMKTEYNDPKAKKSSDRLKVEVKVFNEIGKETDDEKTKHFIKSFDKGAEIKGQTDSFKWLVMGLVSHSLYDLRKEYLKSITWTTIYNIALQTLRAIEDLHEIGYLHRDIKPHNFAIGVPPKDTTIFMLDFGISKRYVDRDGKLRIPRQGVRFIGTVRYASRNLHNEKEQGRRDDLESWWYMMMDMFSPDNMTWRHVSDRTRVGVLKHQLITRQDGREIEGPSVLYKIIAYINDLGYADAPDYARIRSELLDSARREKLDLSRKFDWVGVELEKKPKKKAGAANRVTDDSEETEPWLKEKKEKRRKRFSLENDDSSSESLPPAKPATRRSTSKVNVMHVTPSLKGRVRTSANNPNSRLVTMTARAPLSAMRGVPTGGADVVASPVTVTGTTTGTGAAKSAYNVMTAIPRTPAAPRPPLENSIGVQPGGRKKHLPPGVPPQLPPP